MKKLKHKRTPDFVFMNPNHVNNERANRKLNRLLELGYTITKKNSKRIFLR